MHGHILNCQKEGKGLQIRTGNPSQPEGGNRGVWMKIKMTKKTTWMILSPVIIVLLVTSLWLDVRSKTKTAKIDTTSPMTDHCLYSQPDVIVTSQSLSKLPNDLKKIPYIEDFFKSLIWEDVEQNSARLSLNGTLYRIAFEHDLKIEDILTKIFFNTPATVALWSGYKGTIKDFLVMVPTSLPKDFLFQLASITANDTQIFHDTVLSSDGKKIPAIKIAYAPDRNLFIAENNGSVFAFSNNQCGLPSNPTNAFLKKTWPGGPGETISQEIVISFKYLSGGYSALLDQIDSVRFSYDNQSWKTDIITTNNEPISQQPAEVLWKIIPQDPALCTQFSANTKKLATIFQKMPVSGLDNQIIQADQTALKMFSKQTPHQNVAMCWFEDAPYMAPVFVTKRPATLTDEMIGRVFDKFIGSSEAELNKPIKVLDMVTEKTGQATLFKRNVSVSDLGPHDSDESPNSENFRENTYFKVTLAVTPDYLIFSPEEDNVTRVLSVVAKTFPSLAETLPTDSKNANLVFQPGHFSKLVIKSAEENIEDDFKSALWNRFVPYINLVAQKKNLAIRFDEPNTKKGVVPVKFEEY